MNVIGSHYHVLIALMLIILLALTNLTYISSDQVVSSFSMISVLDPSIPLSINPLASAINTVPENWQCGSTRLQQTAAYHWANLLSSDVLEDLNHCCIAHDSAYDECADRQSVDYVFAECLVDACDQSDVWPLSKHSCTNFVANVFSHLVHTYGESAHQRACENSSRTRLVHSPSTNQSASDVLTSSSLLLL